jgi:hypothetical protein
MSKKITLPSGATVTIKDASDLKVKDRNRIMLAGDESTETKKGIAIGNALLATVIEDWSYDLIIPSVKIESIDELSIPDYTALMKETESLTKELFPDLKETAENASDPKAVTANSNA